MALLVILHDLVTFSPISLVCKTHGLLDVISSYEYFSYMGSRHYICFKLIMTGRVFGTETRLQAGRPGN